jgi:predicted branched-subunit amino acid permease
VSASRDVLAAWSGTLLIYAGSAQLTLLQSLHDGTGAEAAVLAAVLVNLRLAVLSAGMAPSWAAAPLRWKLLVAATVVEPTWAVAEERRRVGGPTRGDDVAARRHHAGAVLLVSAGWLAAVSVGALVGTADRVAPHLVVALPLCLVAMVVPHLRLPGGALAVLAAAVTALAAREVLPGTEVVLAMLAAAAAGSLGTRRRSP